MARGACGRIGLALILILVYGLLPLRGYASGCTPRWGAVPAAGAAACVCGMQARGGACCCGRSAGKGSCCVRRAPAGQERASAQERPFSGGPHQRPSPPPLPRPATAPGGFPEPRSSTPYWLPAEPLLPPPNHLIRG